uniref:Uncharacterized protein n=1 Tax=Glossina palpalis gambiensis TaxID=67801 RepID=A0A1B0B3M3_9MUSC
MSFNIRSELFYKFVQKFQSINYCNQIPIKAMTLNNRRFKVKKIYQPGEARILERLSPLASAAALGMCVSRALKKLYSCKR